jgi:hypothetical protein
LRISGTGHPRPKSQHARARRAKAQKMPPCQLLMLEKEAFCVFHGQTEEEFSPPYFAINSFNTFRIEFRADSLMAFCGPGQLKSLPQFLEKASVTVEGSDSFFMRQ